MSDGALFRARKRIKAEILSVDLQDAIWLKWRAGLQQALLIIDEELEADAEREFSTRKINPNPVDVPIYTAPKKPAGFVDRHPVSLPQPGRALNAISGQGPARGVSV